MRNRKILIRLAFVVIGTVGGFLYWRFIGCASGTCPLTSNWISSSLFGAGAGYLLADVFLEKKAEKEKQEG